MSLIANAIEQNLIIKVTTKHDAIAFRQFAPHKSGIDD
jgi:hypothetical protein